MSSWFEQAENRLKEEYNKAKGQKESVMKSDVRVPSWTSAGRNEEFAQAVVQGGSFQDCMAAVAEGVGRYLSDLEAYRRAASFYFDGAKVNFSMSIQLEPGAVEPRQTDILLDLSDFF